VNEYELALSLAPSEVEREFLHRRQDLLAPQLEQRDSL
jgi:hypothetical protein